MRHKKIMIEITGHAFVFVLHREPNWEIITIPIGRHICCNYCNEEIAGNSDCYHEIGAINSYICSNCAPLK